MRESKPNLPLGTVTFLFTDIEGSTQLVAKIGPRAFGEVLERHNRLIRDAVAAHDGVDAGTAGDSFLVVHKAPSGEGTDYCAVRKHETADPAVHAWAMPSRVRAAGR